MVQTRLPLTLTLSPEGEGTLAAAPGDGGTEPAIGPAQQAMHARPAPHEAHDPPAQPPRARALDPRQFGKALAAPRQLAFGELEVCRPLDALLPALVKLAAGRLIRRR